MRSLKQIQLDIKSLIYICLSGFTLLSGSVLLVGNYWVKLSFTQPQFAPIAIGFAAHFGLGVFIPIDERGKVNRDLSLLSALSIDSS